MQIASLLEQDNAEYELDEVTLDEPQEDGEPVQLLDPAQVSGVLRRLKRLDREAAEINQIADDEIARQNRWREDRLGGVQREVAWRKRSIENWMRLYHKATRKKSVQLADGTPKLATPHERVIVTDPEAFLTWALGCDPSEATAATVPAHPEYVRAKYDPMRGVMKTLPRTPTDKKVNDEAQEYYLSIPLVPGDNGETIPGVQVQRLVELSFDITLGED